MAHLIDCFTELRNIICKYGICVESSKLAARLRTEVTHYFAQAQPHVSSSRDRQVARAIVERANSLMIIVIGVDLSTHNGFWLSRLNNLQTDLYNFLRKLKMCGPNDALNFTRWYAINGAGYSKKSHAYRIWARLRDQRNRMLNLQNLMITRHYKKHVNLAAFKGVYITKNSNSENSSMTSSPPPPPPPHCDEDSNQSELQKLNDSGASIKTPRSTNAIINYNITASHLARAILPYDREMGVTPEDWRYAQATFEDPDDIRLLNVTKHQATLQYHKLEILRLYKKYSIVESQRCSLCLQKLRLLCHWLDYSDNYTK